MKRLSLLGDDDGENGEPSSRERKRAKIAASCGDIKTEQLFKENFGGFSIAKNPTCLLAKWIEKEKVRDWVKTISSRFIPLFYKLKRNFVYSLYPLIVDIILPVLEMSAFAFTATVKQGLDSDQVEELSEAIALSQQASASNSRSNSAEGKGPQVAVPSSCPITIDTTDPEDNKMFIREIEKQLKSLNYPNKGRVEIAVVENQTNSIKMLVEAKVCVIGDNRAGFYQLCAELVLAQKDSATKVFGVYTDHFIWQFVQLDGNKISYSDCYQLLAAAAINNKMIFNEEVVDIFCHLLEIFDIPTTAEFLLAMTMVKDSWIEEKRTLLISKLP